ncbi:hypothetical protein CMUS01_12064 [Colletotrichum musicola]|uniref:Uncharacterized protein n=1 Tax=Colletotrichum musicola TaxID=2175873 RepID=A0A8H6JQT0_9PEZI|nr:hypothetical protein CMUS01_12064 [Colletotrichum musicola]
MSVAARSSPGALRATVVLPPIEGSDGGAASQVQPSEEQTNVAGQGYLYRSTQCLPSVPVLTAWRSTDRPAGFGSSPKLPGAPSSACEKGWQLSPVGPSETPAKIKPLVAGPLGSPLQVGFTATRTP